MTRKYILLVLFSFLFALPYGICSAQTYQITEQELNQLDQNLIALSNLNNQLSNELLQSKQGLVVVRTELVKYQQDLLQTQKELVQLSNESKLAKQNLLQAQNSLLVANESLIRYDKEAKSDIRRLEWQRNITIGLLIYSAIR